MREVIYHEHVEGEVSRAAVYYERQCEGLGSRFLDDYDRTVSDITERPSAWPSLDGPYRRHQLRHFPYGIYHLPYPPRLRARPRAHAPAPAS